MSTGGRVNRRLKLAIPWVLSAAVVAYVVLTVDLAKVQEHIVQADLGAFIGIVAAFTLVVFVADSATLLILFRRFLAPVNFREVLAIKGVSYFFNALNYSAGSGSMALFLKKKRDLSFLESLSTLVWLNFIDVLVLVVMLVMGLLVGGDLLPDAQREVVPWLLVGVSCVAAGALVYWQLGFDFFVLGRMRSWRIFRAFREAKGRDYLHLIAARFLFICLYVLMAWATLPTFDIGISLAALWIYIPLLTFVQIVPASFSGLGAIQVVMAALYAHYLGGGDDLEARVYAYSFLIGPLTTLIRLVMGYAFVANISRDFVPKMSELSSVDTEN